MDEIVFRVTDERLEGIKIGIKRKLGRDYDANVRYLAFFMVDEDGDWMEEEAALAILDEHTDGEIGDFYDQLREAIEEATVPKA